MCLKYSQIGNGSITNCDHGRTQIDSSKDHHLLKASAQIGRLLHSPPLKRQMNVRKNGQGAIDGCDQKGSRV